MANTVIALKSSGQTGNVPSAASLEYGELAINYADGVLYFKNGPSSVGTVSATQPSGLNQEIQFNDSGSFGANASLTFNKSTGLLSTPIFKSTQSIGSEGGQIDLAIAASGTTLSGSVAIDIYGDKLRIFETGGTNRGVYIDIASGASSGVGTNLLAPAGGSVTYVAGATGTVSNTQLLAGILTVDGASSGLDADLLDGQHGSYYTANVGAGLITVTNNYQANVGAGLISAKAVSEANVGAGLITAQANVGAGLISAKSVSEANVGAGLLAAKSVSEANVGAGLATKYSKTGGEISGDVTITGNLTIGGSTTTVSATNLAVTDNMLYLNQAIETSITNAVGDGANVTYTTASTHNYLVGMTVTVTDISPSGYNVTSNTIVAVSSNTFKVASTFTGSYVSGGTARARATSNPDLGFAAGYNDGAYHHTGLFRDATDGIYKLFYNYDPEPDASPYIDTSNSSFRIANLTANLITDVVTLRGLDPLNYSNTIYTQAQANSGAGLISLSSTLTSAYQANAGAGVISAKSFTQTVYDSSNTKVSSVAGVSAGAVSNTQLISGIQAVSSGYGITFDYVATANNGQGTNYKVGDDAWIGDYNTSNALKIKGQQDSNQGYISFGSNTSTLGVNGTGPLTYGSNTIWHAGNDGTGSGLDADLLDGNDSAYFTANAGAGLISLSTTLTSAYQANAGAGVIDAKSFTQTVYNSSNTKVSSVAGVSAGAVSNNQILSGLLNVDGAGSGLDADLLDGYNTSQSATASTVAVRDSDGSLTANIIISTNNGNGTNYKVGDDAWIGDTNIANALKIKGQQDSNQGYIAFGNSSMLFGQANNGSLTFNANQIWHAGNDGTGSGLDADLLDGNDSAYFTANTGAGLISLSSSLTSAYQANVGAGLISAKAVSEANVGAGLISAKSTSEANVGAGIISAKSFTQTVYDSSNTKVSSVAGVSAGAVSNNQILTGLLTVDGAGSGLDADLLDGNDSAYFTANTGAGLISLSSTLTSAYQANVGAGLITAQANVGAGLISLSSSLTSAYQANVGAGLLAAKSVSEANVGAGLILAKSVSEANVGAGLLAAKSVSEANVGIKVSKAGDTMTGVLNISNTTTSTSTGTGALIVGGGVGVAENLYVGGDAVVTGNLTINGTTTTVNSTTVSVDDKNIELGSVAIPSDVTADGGGITLKGGTDKTFNWVNATGAWTSSENINLASGKDYYLNGTSVTSLYQANTGAGLISLSSTLTSAYQANVGDGLLASKSVSEANVGAGLIATTSSITSAYQANVGAGLIATTSSITSAYQANVGAGLISTATTSQANVGAGLIALNGTLSSAYQANVGAGLIALNSSVTSAYQANVGAGLLAAKSVSEANVGAGLITLNSSVTSAYQANTGAALITAKAYTDTETTNRQANVGAAVISLTSDYQANAGLALISAKSYTDTANTNLKSYVDTELASISINDLTDVDTITSAPTTGQYLKWNGTNWVPSTVSGTSNTITYSEQTVVSDSYTANGSSTTFAVSIVPDSEDHVLVMLNGVIQDPSEYSLSGTTITFSTAPSNGDNVELRTFSGYSTSASVTNYKSYRYTLANNTTTLSGNDDNLNSLSYTAERVEVYVNGVRFSDGIDYTATNGTSIAFTETVVANSVVEVVSLATATMLSNSIQTESIALSTNTANQAVASFAISDYRSAKYLIQMSHASAGYHATEALIIHDGTNTYMTEYGTIYTGANSLGTISSSISSNTVLLMVSPVNANTTVKTKRIPVET